MQKLLVALVAAGMLAVAMPVNANANSNNVRYFLDQLGLDSIPAGTATIYTAEGEKVVSIAEAFEIAAARAGDVDLAAVIAGLAAPGDATGVGDVWILEIGYGACPATTIYSASPVPNTYYHGQFWTYAGALGSQSSSGAGFMIDWTTKGLTGGAYGSGATTQGQSDMFCISFFGLYIWFPFLNGVATSD